MSKYKTRKDKTCLNCGSYVEKRYCPQCGQENKESRESFFHLVLEFVFDLVHFDSSFWKTTSYLIFSPAKLSLEYMAGRRKSHVNPIKLYIFVSFIAFFLPGILPVPDKKDSDTEKENSVKIEAGKYGDIYTLAELDSIHLSKPENERIRNEEYIVYRSILEKKEDKEEQDKDISELINISEDIHINGFNEIGGYGYVKNISELDSIHQSKPANERLPFLKYNSYKLLFQFGDNVKNEDKKEKAIEFIIHNFPKVLFVYMPIFAFWMWLFNLNRRKHYFDSCIFTLHFFSFWLLLITFYNILACILTDWLNYKGITYFMILPFGLLYITFYFFRANRRFYNERRWLANLKAFLLFHIHTFFIILVLIGFLFLAFTRMY